MNSFLSKLMFLRVKQHFEIETTAIQGDPHSGCEQFCFFVSNKILFNFSCRIGENFVIFSCVITISPVDSEVETNPVSG